MRALALVCSLLVLVSCADDVAPGPEQPTTSAATAPESSHPPASIDEVAGRVRAMAQARVDDGAYPGAIVLVRIGGDVRVVAVGVNDLKRGTPMSETDTFPVASITKPMVATATLRLVEQGELSLDDPVEKWLPGLVAGGNQILIEHLLSHRSGLQEDTRGQDHETFEEIVRAVAEEHRIGAPGEKSYYSNVNYFLLGLVLEKVTGRGLAEVLDDQVFTPAHMDATRLNSPMSAAGAGLVHGYEDGEDVTGLAGDLYAAGGVVSTVGDVSRFLEALLAGDLVAPEVVSDMVRSRGGLMNMGGDYGLGIRLLDGACGPQLGHSGRLPGFATEAWAVEGGARSVVVMVNTTDSGDSFSPPLADAALCDR